MAHPPGRGPLLLHSVPSRAVRLENSRLEQAKLRETLNCLLGTSYYLHEGPLVIGHAPGAAFPTAELDHLAVTARQQVMAA